MQKHQPANTSPAIGNRVAFDSDYGLQSGRVIDLIPCLLNGREHAVVAIEHELPGIFHRVPADTLTII